MTRKKFSFGVDVETVDQTGEILAVYIQIRKGKTKTTKEHADGNLFADYDAGGRLLGIEMLGPSPPAVLEEIVKGQSEKRFVRRAVPSGMLVTA